MTFRINEYNIKNEVWKDIPMYEGIYQASNLGRVRSVDGKITHSNRHGVRVWKGRILKNKTKVVSKQIGYRVTLWKNKKPKDWLVCRLVCLAFYGIPNNFNSIDIKKRMTVNHIDGNRLNNHVDNLEWVTLKENIQHAFQTGIVKTQHKIALVNKNGVYKEFNSKSQAGLWLGRSVGYISLRLKKGKNTAFDKTNNEYKIVKVLKE